MDEKKNEQEEKKGGIIPTDPSVFKRYGNLKMKTAEERRLEEEKKSLDGKQEGNSAGNTDGNKQGNVPSNSTSNIDGNTEGKKDGIDTSNTHVKTDGNIDGIEHGNTPGNNTRNAPSNMDGNSTGNKHVELPAKESRKYKKKASIIDEIRNEKKLRNKITIYLDRDIDDALKQIAGKTRGGMKSEYINRILREQMIKDGLLDEE